MTKVLPTLLLAAVAAGSAQASCPDPEQDARIDIYPTAAVLPENLLRFYVYFPRRMGQEDILPHIAILDEAGYPVEEALLRNRYDLWSPDRRRLTLLLDPGRVKTGLAAHEAMGRALEPGRRYGLSIGGAATDAEGCPLGQDTLHGFRVGPADLDPPAPGAWAVSAPRAGTTEPLVVDLGSAHDHLSLAYRLRVHDAGGTPVAGAVELGEAEAAWRFVPAQPWAAAPHRISIDARLEDLAGNRPGVPFDRPRDAVPVGWAEELPFRPTKASP
jgi:hypothetical protein